MLNWTPFIIRIVLHHYCSPTPCEHRDAPIYADVVESLVDCGVLKWREKGPQDESPHEITGLGKALVEMWCAQPLPVVRYADPRFEGASPR